VGSSSVFDPSPTVRQFNATLELTIDTPNASKSLSFRNQSIEDSSNLPDPDIIAAEIDSQIPICSPFGLPVHVDLPTTSIVEDLQAALAQFAEIASNVKK
jgi:hypothetical protein